jgi:hypothetical protein
MEKPKRLYFYRGKVFFNYCIQYLERFRYDEDDTKIQYHGYDEHAIGFGLSNKWFGLDNDWFDGHTFNGITLFYIIFFHTYTFQTEIKQ